LDVTGKRIDTTHLKNTFEIKNWEADVDLLPLLNKLVISANSLKKNTENPEWWLGGLGLLEKDQISCNDDKWKFLQEKFADELEQQGISDTDDLINDIGDAITKGEFSLKSIEKVYKKISGFYSKFIDEKFDKTKLIGEEFPKRILAIGNAPVVLSLTNVIRLFRPFFKITGSFEFREFVKKTPKKKINESDIILWCCEEEVGNYIIPDMIQFLNSVRDQEKFEGEIILLVYNQKELEVVENFKLFSGCLGHQVTLCSIPLFSLIYRFCYSHFLSQRMWNFHKSRSSECLKPLKNLLMECIKLFNGKYDILKRKLKDLERSLSLENHIELVEQLTGCHIHLSIFNLNKKQYLDKGYLRMLKSTLGKVLKKIEHGGF
jgi:hypothetical protein